MPTISWPLARDAQDIVGRIVVIALDPVASVAALNDERATAEAAAFSARRYLALVTGYLDFLWTPDGPRLTLDFSPGASGLPPAPNAWAAVPLSPALPQGGCTRPPVSPDPPLPPRWDSCYLYTLHFTGGTVCRIHHAEKDSPRLDEEALMAVFTAQYEDRRRIGLAHRARLAEEAAAAQSAEADRHSSDEAKDAAPSEGRRDVDAEAQQEAQQNHEIEDDDEHALMEELFAHDAVPRMTPHFEIWYDPAVFSPEELGDPAQVQSEIDRLEEIEWAWAQRTVAEGMSKGPETNAWLIGIGEADAPPQSAGIDAAFDDGLVEPADAIEHRMEQGALRPVEAREREIQSLDGLSSVTGSRLTGSSTSSSIATDQSKNVSPSGIGGLSVFRIVLRSVASFVLRLRSITWGLIFWRPNAAR